MEVTFTPAGQTVILPDEVAAWANSAATGMMDAGELQCLAASLALYPWDRDPDAIVVEIGAFEGTTTVFMARVLRALGRPVTILSIDPFERATADALNPQGVESAYLRNVREAGFEDLCLPLLAFSQPAAAVVPNRVGVLVVDGSHHYEAIKSDLSLYGRKLLPGGVMFVDDYGVAYPDVMRAVDEYFHADAPFNVLHKAHFVIARRHEGPGGKRE